MLKTSYSSKERVSALQRKLYQKAKQQPEFRFYALYDKVYRNDVLQRSYDLVKQNKGSPGLDGMTFEACRGLDSKAINIDPSVCRSPEFQLTFLGRLPRER